MKGVILGHNRIVIALSRVQRFLPSGCTQTPFTATRQTNLAEIIPSRGAEVEKFIGDRCCFYTTASAFASSGTGQMLVNSTEGLVNTE